jgi:cobalt-zinc-cadmium efflux system membrane fusion protein
MFAQVEIAARATDERLTQSEPVVAVPDEAIQTVEGRTAIFVPVPNEPGTFSKRTVAIGRSVGGRVPVYSGLKEGDLVVVKGTFILKAELGKAEAAHEH